VSFSRQEALQGFLPPLQRGKRQKAMPKKALDFLSRVQRCQPPRMRLGAPNLWRPFHGPRLVITIGVDVPVFPVVIDVEPLAPVIPAKQKVFGDFGSVIELCC
jgi:hypothetical protein